ncbi:cob(I)yrinic acid a,c-diamide adenosyltransferase [Candidatus Parcubacteria bacterium]|nr:cob(I)yrinic acid a,c-diamide adenosyltransferase [Candidatus Parcubacteria bacterium]
MSLFTGKGDDGTTKTLGCDQRMSKSSAIAEALGTVDEVNSFLGFLKIEGRETGFEFESRTFDEIISEVQQNLFIVQAELGGSEGYKIDPAKVEKMSETINNIEKSIPPINSFFVSGGCRISTLFDYARTISRRAERRVITVVDEGKVQVSDGTKAYLNRLSSLLYAMARLSNHLSGIKEESPNYK